MLSERKEVDYLAPGFEPELMAPAEVLAALRAEVNQLVMDLPVSSIWLRIWLPKAIRAHKRDCGWNSWEFSFLCVHSDGYRKPILSCSSQIGYP